MNCSRQVLSGKQTFALLDIIDFKNVSRRNIKKPYALQTYSLLQAIIKHFKDTEFPLNFLPRKQPKWKFGISQMWRQVYKRLI